MLIEGAFWKLPEIFLREWFPDERYEAGLTSAFAMGILLELSARNIDFPTDHVQLERRYTGLQEDQPNWRVDLYATLPLPFSMSPKDRYYQYGVKPENWIESKLLIDRRGRANVPKVSSTASVMKDLIRLCILPEEERSSDRKNGRYLVLVCDDDPSSYLAGRRRDGSKREWLSKLLAPGVSQGEFVLADEGVTFREKLGFGFRDDPAIKFEFTTHTMCFEPLAPSLGMKPLYRGYLVRVDAFTVRIGAAEMNYSTTDQDTWTAARETSQRAVIAEFVARASDQTEE